MNKQIEEISEILTEAAHKACEDIPFAPPNDDDRCIRPTMECHRCKEARALIDAGYRKKIEGEWIEHGEIGAMNNAWECSACHWKTVSFTEMRHSKFCPNCGAKMKGGGKE